MRDVLFLISVGPTITLIRDVLSNLYFPLYARPLHVAKSVPIYYTEGLREIILREMVFEINHYYSTSSLRTPEMLP